ncbi:MULTISPECIES: GNAT family N-acetyltransferase [unclassified Siphonobacter]|uniref:GNAT family N-acetyltransferase n=1 Tax=unclassified Siphonobacter TaxID=2635712 RepID=UPI00114037D5|nr:MULTISPECIES: GNAT family N-acetyltransferase [unclassified Siphonobacter]
MIDIAKVPVQLRLGTKDDTKVLTKLASETMREAFGEQNESKHIDAYISQAFHKLSVQAELADTKHNTFWLAFQGEELVGYCKLNRKSEKPRNLKGYKAVELQRIYVYDQYKGQGIGKQLLDACLEQARQEKYQAVFLGVWEKNESAIHFYEHMGFEKMGWHYFLFGFDRQRDYWMVKHL